MFQFSGFASITGYPVFNGMGCPIRIFTDQWLFAPTHDFSQLITSFFASESPGIRHAPLFTFLVGVFPFLKRRTLKHYYFFAVCSFCFLSLMFSNMSMNVSTCVVAVVIETIHLLSVQPVLFPTVLMIPFVKWLEAGMVRGWHGQNGCRFGYPFHLSTLSPFYLF